MCSWTSLRPKLIAQTIARTPSLTTPTLISPTERRRMGVTDIRIIRMRRTAQYPRPGRARTLSLICGYNGILNLLLSPSSSELYDHASPIVMALVFSFPLFFRLFHPQPLPQCFCAGHRTPLSTLRAGYTFVGFGCVSLMFLLVVVLWVIC